MRKLSLFLGCFFCISVVFASFPNPTSDSTQASNQNTILRRLPSMTVKEFEGETGKKLNLAEKLSFKLMQRRLKKHPDASGSNNAGIAIGGFALGFFLSVIGVLIAYLLPKNVTLRKWALIGFISGLLFFLVALSIALASLGNFQ